MPDASIWDSKITFRMSEELHVRLKLVAVTERKTIQEILNALALAYVEKKEGTKTV